MTNYYRELILSGYLEASRLYNDIQELFAEYPDEETRIAVALALGVVSAEEARSALLYYYAVIRRLETNESVS